MSKLQQPESENTAAGGKGFLPTSPLYPQWPSSVPGAQQEFKDFMFNAFVDGISELYAILTPDTSNSLRENSVFFLNIFHVKDCRCFPILPYASQVWGGIERGLLQADRVQVE